MGGIAESGPDGNADAGSVYVASYNGGSLTGGDFALRAWGDTGTGSVEITTDDCDCSSGTIEVNNLTLESSADLDVPTIGGDITVAGKLELNSRGNITMDDVTAGYAWISKPTAPSPAAISMSPTGSRAERKARWCWAISPPGRSFPAGDDNSSVAIKSETSITVGDITAAGDVGFATFGDLTTGNISAGDLILAMVGGDMTFGSLDDRVGRPGLSRRCVDVHAPAAVSATVMSAISIRRSSSPSPPSRPADRSPIGGAVTTGRFQAAAGHAIFRSTTSPRRIRSNCLAGGMANFTGTVSAPDITVTSGDINIAEGAQARRLGRHRQPYPQRGHRPATVYHRRQSTVRARGQPIIFDEDRRHRRDQHRASTRLAGSRIRAPDIIVGDVHIDGSDGEDPAVSHVTLNSDSSIIVAG